jgi:hypothetical protein
MAHWSLGNLFTVNDPVEPWSTKLPPSRRFTIVIDGAAVLDNETGLVWQRAPSVGTTGHATTLIVCAVADTGGRRGWRVPVLSELLSLVEPGAMPSLPVGHPFSLGATPRFWSHTAPPNTNVAFVFDFEFGNLSNPPVTDQLRTWCVRGGASPVH